MTTTTSTTQPTSIYASGLSMWVNIAAAAALETKLKNEVVLAISTISFSYSFITTILDQTTGTKPADASAKLIAEMSFNLNWLAGQIEAEPILSASQDIFNLLHNGRQWLYQAHDLQAKAEAERTSDESRLQQVEAILEGIESGMLDAHTALQQIAEATIGKQIDLTEMQKWADIDADVKAIHALQDECEAVFGVMDAPADLPEAHLQALQNDFIFGDDEDIQHDQHIQHHYGWNAALNEKDSPAGW